VAPSRPSNQSGCTSYIRVLLVNLISLYPISLSGANPNSQTFGLRPRVPRIVEYMYADAHSSLIMCSKFYTKFNQDYLPPRAHLSVPIPQMIATDGYKKGGNIPHFNQSTSNIDRCKTCGSSNPSL